MKKLLLLLLVVSTLLLFGDENVSNASKVTKTKLSKDQQISATAIKLMELIASTHPECRDCSVYIVSQKNNNNRVVLKPGAARFDFYDCK